MNYETKQEWIEAVMASDLGVATKVYAFGIFKHMYGTKDNAFPSGKAIAKATGLTTGKFYLHNKALADAGFLEVTHRMGMSNLYQLAEPTHTVGNHLPTEEVRVPTKEVTPTHTVGTNTTSKTTKKTSNVKTSKSAGALDKTSLPKEDEEPSFEEVVEPLLDDSTFSLHDAAQYTEFEKRSISDWNGIRNVRPFTKDEKYFLDARASAYQAARHAKEEAVQKEEAW